MTDGLIRLLSAVCVVIGASLVGGLLGYSYAADECAAEKAAAREKAVELAGASAVETTKVEAQAGAVRTRIERVFIDRIQYRDREVPVEVRIREDAECVVPARFVRMWNSANRAEVPDAPRQPDGGAHRTEGDAVARGSEAVGHREAARGGSPSDAPQHGAAQEPDRVGPPPGAALRSMNESVATVPQQRVGAIDPG